jgi:DNA-binding CsgD family transcriptional regulator
MIPESAFSNQEISDSFLKKVNGNLATEILDKIKVFICVFDSQCFKIHWANNYLLRKMDYSLEELQNMTMDEILLLIHPDFLDYFFESTKRSTKLPLKENYSIYKIRTKKKKWFWLLTNHCFMDFNHDVDCRYKIAFGTEIDYDHLCIQINKLKNKEINIPGFDLINLLSTRQKTIIKLIARGNTDKEIAEILNISIHTSKTHRKNIIHKLGLKNSHTLIKYALENGLV